MNKKAKRRSPLAGWNRSAKAGLFILVFFLLVAVLAPVIAPYSPDKRTGKTYERPSAEHLLGTNDIGEDILSEMIYGTRVSLSVGLLAALGSVALGTLLGMAGGYMGGAVDSVITTLIDILLAVPGFTLTVVLVAYIGSQGILGMAVIIAISSWAGTARIVRTRTRQLRETPFVQIETTLGVGRMYTLIRHILPNVMDIVGIRFAMSVGSAMMTETSLSFLGLTSFTTKSWGNVLHYAFFRNGLYKNYWWWYGPPILCITLCVLSCTMLVNKDQKRLNIQYKAHSKGGGGHA